MRVVVVVAQMPVQRATGAAVGQESVQRETVAAAAAVVVEQMPVQRAMAAVVAAAGQEFVQRRVLVLQLQ